MDCVECAINRLHCSDTNKTTAQIAFVAKKPIAQVHNDRYYGLYDMPASEPVEVSRHQTKSNPLR